MSSQPENCLITNGCWLWHLLSHLLFQLLASCSHFRVLRRRWRWGSTGGIRCFIIIVAPDRTSHQFSLQPQLNISYNMIVYTYAFTRWRRPRRISVAFSSLAHKRLSWMARLFRFFLDVGGSNDPLNGYNNSLNSNLSSCYGGMGMVAIYCKMAFLPLSLKSPHPSKFFVSVFYTKRHLQFSRGEVCFEVFAHCSSFCFLAMEIAFLSQR